jgi:hypothetical protein
MYRVKPPSKALSARQAFDIEGLSNFADDKAARHHKAFSGEVEIGILPSRQGSAFAPFLTMAARPLVLQYAARSRFAGQNGLT